MLRPINFDIELTQNNFYQVEVNQGDDLFFDLFIYKNGEPVTLSGQSVSAKITNNGVFVLYGQDKMTKKDNELKLTCKDGCEMPGDAALNITFNDTDGICGIYEIGIKVIEDKSVAAVTQKSTITLIKSLRDATTAANKAIADGDTNLMRTDIDTNASDIEDLQDAMSSHVSANNESITSLQSSITTLQNTVAALKSTLFPVGTILVRYDKTNPSTFLGGTWKMIEDKFLLGITASGTIGTTGGEKTHTLTVNEMPSHQHKGYYQASCVPSGNVQGRLVDSNATVTYDFTTGNITATTGGGAAHNNMPPYTQVAIWRRTA